MFRRFLLSLWLLVGSLGVAHAQSAYCPMNALSAKTIPTPTYTSSDADECLWLVFTSHSSNTLILPSYATNGQFLAGWNAGVIALSAPVTVTFLPNKITGKYPTINGVPGPAPLNLAMGQNAWLRVGLDGNWYYFLNPAPGTGNIVGPPSSVVGDIAAWNNTAGTLLSDSGIPFSSLVTASNSVSLSNKGINCTNNTCLNWPLNSVTGVLAVALGGTGLSSGTSGGILGFSASGTIASSGALTANLPVMGGGAGGLPFSGSVTGNTTIIVTSTGALVNGDCVSIDGHGNFIDAGGPCTVGGGGGTVTSGTATHLTYYPASTTSVSSAPDAVIVNGALSLGALNTAIGTVALFGNTSGSVLITPRAVAGSPTITLPTTTGTFADAASLPIVLNATTGNLTCPTCATTTNGGAITGTAPVSVSAGGVVSLTGAAAGTMLAGVGPTFTSTPSLGVNGVTPGSLTIANGSGSGTSITIQNLSNTTPYNLNLAPTAGTIGQPLLSGGGGAASMSFATLGPGGGGLGVVNPTIHCDLIGEGSSAVVSVCGTTGTVLTGATGADPAYSATPTLGAVGTLGTLSLAGNTSGVITLQPQAAAGTYNFNFPTTAGNANQPLLSGGGGSSPMIYGTLSGSTSEFGTVTGVLTPGDCIKADASGNLVDAGAACAAGSTTFTIAAGLTNTVGTRNNGAQTIVNNSTLSPQQIKVSKAVSYTVNSDNGGTSDTGAMLVATANGVTFTAPNPAVGTAGNRYQFGSDGTHGFVLTTVGASAQIYGCFGPGAGVTAFTFAANIDIQLIDDGTGYKCSQFAGGGGGGGSGTVAGGNQYQAAYYAATGTTVSGTSIWGTNANNQLVIGGGMVFVRRAIAAGTSDTATVADYIISYTSLTAPFAETLPACSSIKQRYELKDEAQMSFFFPITVSAPGSTFEGATNAIIRSNGASATFSCDGISNYEVS